MRAEGRRDLEDALGHAVSDDVWLVMTDDGHVSEYEGGFSDLSVLEARYRLLTGLRAPRSSSPRLRELPPDDRLEARSAVLAEQAAKLEDVQTFRRHWLPTGLLSPGGVEQWIAAHRPEQHITLATFEVGADSRPASDARPRWVGTDRLEYTIPTDESEKQVPVDANGALRQLRTVATNLAHATGWKPGATATFILTGIVPKIPLARVTRREIETHLGTYARVILDVDPGAPPTMVASLFREARAMLHVTRRRRSKRPPALLLQFVQARRGEAWPSLMAAWNAEYPNYRYEHITNMQRDYARSRKQAEEGVKDV